MASILKDFVIPQNRNIIYIIGNKNDHIFLEFSAKSKQILGNILEKGEPILNTKFTQLLLSNYSLEKLAGKSIKDKRGGQDNIHGWDIDLKGKNSSEQKELLNLLLKQRRRKIWSKKKLIYLKN